MSITLCAFSDGAMSLLECPHGLPSLKNMDGMKRI